VCHHAWLRKHHFCHMLLIRSKSPRLAGPYPREGLHFFERSVKDHLRSLTLFQVLQGSQFV
jgi:hypothetical protein